MNSIKIALLGIGIILLGIALSTSHFWAYTLGVIGFCVIAAGCFWNDWKGFYGLKIKKHGLNAVNMKRRRKYAFWLMTALYFIIVICICVTRFNIIMTIVGGPTTHIDAVNLLPFHSIRENLEYGRKPISWDMIDNMVMFVPIGIVYCYYQKNFVVYKAIILSFSTTLLIECAQFVLKTGVVDIDDLIINTLGGLIGILLYSILSELSKSKKVETHEVIDIIATMLPPIFIAFVVEMFMGDGSPKFFLFYLGVLLCYGFFVYEFLIKDITRKAKTSYLVCYVGAFYLSRLIL